LKSKEGIKTKMPTEEELKEFLKIPKTPLGKLEAMNSCFLKEDNLEEAFKQVLEFMDSLIRNNPDYLEALKDCRTEEEIKIKTEEFFKKNPKMIEEVELSLIAARRDAHFNDKKNK
jgi:hypothetical protein